MKIADWLKSFVGVYVTESEDDTIEEMPEVVEPAPAPDMLKTVPREERVYKGIKAEEETGRPGKLSISMYSPQNINDCRQIADTFKAGSPVIINLECTKTDDARHIYLFMRGCCYALNGVCQQIGENVFLFTPSEIGCSDIGKGASLENTFSFTWGKHRK